AQQGATVNQTEGWVQNLNQTNIQSQLAAYQNQLQAYVNTQKPNGTATVGDVLGTERIIPNNVGTSNTPPTILPGSLPYKVITNITTAPRYATLPDNLRHQFQYKLIHGRWSNNGTCDACDGFGRLLLAIHAGTGGNNLAIQKIRTEEVVSC
ncbi:MAG: hypothetical protein ING66_01185, partial [Rhodocyclaceae bacterium]|nr:hypothetical protein [Rhodocyclaceae bacterium]